MTGRFASRAGAASSPGVQAMGRNLWRGLAEQLRTAGRMAAAGEPLPRSVEAELRLKLKRIGSAPLPVDGESARHVRAAFLGAAEALLISAGDRRGLVADLAVAAADCLEALIDAQTQAAAATWQRQFKD